MGGASTAVHVSQPRERAAAAGRELASTVRGATPQLCRSATITRQEITARARVTEPPPETGRLVLTHTLPGNSTLGLVIRRSGSFQPGLRSAGPSLPFPTPRGSGQLSPAVGPAGPDTGGFRARRPARPRARAVASSPCAPKAGKPWRRQVGSSWEEAPAWPVRREPTHPSGPTAPSPAPAPACAPFGVRSWSEGPAGSQESCPPSGLRDAPPLRDVRRRKGASPARVSGPELIRGIR